jgi:hypothetical protein
MNTFIAIAVVAILVTILLTRSKVEDQDNEQTSKL